MPLPTTMQPTAQQTPANTLSGTSVTAGPTTAPMPGQTTGQPATNPMQINPTYLSQLFPNMQALMQNPALLYGVPNINPQQFTGAVTKSMLPQFQQQDKALMSGLADAGIVGGSTGGALGALGNQQQTQLAGQISPMIQQIMQGNQQVALQGGEFNANTQNQVSQQDIDRMLGVGEYDANTANQFESQGLGFQNQDYLAELQAMAGMYSGQAGAFQPIYQQPSQGGFDMSGFPWSSFTGGGGGGASGWGDDGGATSTDPGGSW